MGNLVLYAIEQGVRRPLISLAPDDPLASAKFTAKIANEMRSCEQRGIPLSGFKAVLEERTADEGGKIIGANFTEIDPHTGDNIGGVKHDLEQLFPGAQ